MASHRGVKYCPKCGTGYALQASNTCGVCGSEIRTDKQRKELSRLNTRRYYYDKVEEFRSKQSDVALMQQGLPTLTEAEWQKAVSHFKGCATCGSEDIDGRMMFILPDNGGKYNRGNVLPGCKECMNKIIQKDWAAAMRAQLRDTGDKSIEVRFNAIIDYLKQEATRE